MCRAGPFRRSGPACAHHLALFLTDPCCFVPDFWRVVPLALAFALPVAAQPTFSLVPDADAPDEHSILPNGTWATTPYENESVLNDDWTFGTATGIAVDLFWILEAGTDYGAVSSTVTWDPAALAFDGVTEVGGIFEPPAGTFFSSSLGAPDGVRMDAALLGASNATTAVGEYAARLTVRVLRPGFSPIPLSSPALRQFTGTGGQLDVAVATEDAAVRAYLGDVAAAVPMAVGDPTRADGVVDFEDVVVFTQGYYAGTTATGGSLATYKAKLDIGPTDDGTPLSRPQPDLQIEFEDLIVFALSYGYSQTGIYPAARGATTPVRLEAGPAEAGEGAVRVPLVISGAADLRALALEADLNPALRWGGVVGVEGGFRSDDEREVFLTSATHDGRAYIDAAILGGSSLEGNRTFVEVLLFPTNSQSPEDFEGRTDLLTLDRARLRTSANVSIPVTLGVSTETSDGVPTHELGLAVGPNPSRGPLMFAMDLPIQGPVYLRIYDVLGRLVEEPVAADLRAGRHTIPWTSRLPSGTYVAVAEAAGARRSVRFSISR